MFTIRLYLQCVIGVADRVGDLHGSVDQEPAVAGGNAGGNGSPEASIRRGRGGAADAGSLVAAPATCTLDHMDALVDVAPKQLPARL